MIFTKLIAENMEISYREGVWKRVETIGKLIRVGPIGSTDN